MSFTHTLTFGWSNGSTSLSNGINATSDTELNLDAQAAALDADQPIAIVLDVTQIKSFYMVSDKAVTLTFTTTGSPIVVELAANTPYVWIDGMNTTNPLTDDITAASIDNSGNNATATVKLRFLIDGTA